LIVAQLCAGAALADAVTAAKARLRREPHHDETLDAIERAVRFAAAGGDRGDAIAHLGEGWVAEEALAIALYCASVAGDFADGVTLAVNHDGDSDSTGSIAGNLLGTMLGASAIPARWREGVELSGVIAEVAVRLHGLGRLAAAGTDASP
jgi:ADP-ribosylglycohydrolase